MTTPVGSLHHVGIVVRRLDEAERFAGTVLGFSLARRLESEELAVRMAFFDGGPALVELIEFGDPRLAAAKLGDQDAVIDHVALEVPDLSDAVASLGAHGVATAQEAPLCTPLGRFHFTKPETSAGVIWQLLELGSDGRPQESS